MRYLRFSAAFLVVLSFLSVPTAHAQVAQPAWDQLLNGSSFDEPAPISATTSENLDTILDSQSIVDQGRQLADYANYLTILATYAEGKGMNEGVIAKLQQNAAQVQQNATTLLNAGTHRTESVDAPTAAPGLGASG